MRCESWVASKNVSNRTTLIGVAAFPCGGAMNDYAEAKEALQKSSGNWKESIRALPEAWRKGWKKR